MADEAGPGGSRSWRYLRIGSQYLLTGELLLQPKCEASSGAFSQSSASPKISKRAKDGKTFRNLKTFSVIRPGPHTRSTRREGNGFSSSLHDLKREFEMAGNEGHLLSEFPDADGATISKIPRFGSWESDIISGVVKLQFPVMVIEAIKSKFGLYNGVVYDFRGRLGAQICSLRW